MVVPNNIGYPLKIIILGCFWGTTIFGNPHMFEATFYIIAALH